MVLIPLLSYADAVEIDGIYYNLVKKAKIAEVTKSPKRYSGDVVIPEKVTFEDIEYDVTSIASSAFSVDWHDICLTSITIPKSITSIGKDAFMSFSTEIVNILDLESWCKISFTNRYSNPLRKAEKIYVNGEEISELTIPNSLTSIGDYAFDGCRSLKSVVIPNTITSIGNYSFAMCLGLTSIEIPISTTSIGDYAFDGCTGLKSLMIPNSVTSIGDCAFLSCSFLTSVSIPSSVKEVGYSAFSSCERLNSVHISNIESWCDIIFFNELSNPLSYAHHIYLNDNEITDLDIPDNITTIRKYVFYGASSITSVTIPDGVTSIGDYVFKGCGNMSSVTIPKSILSIGKYSFSDCTELSDVYCYADNMPTTYSDVFLNSYTEHATLHVPEGCVDAYKAVAPWSGFKEIVSIAETKYNLTYLVDGEVYKTYQLKEGETITPEPAPTKEHSVFSGWSKIPETMPAHNVEITGSFSSLSDYDEIKIGTSGINSFSSSYDLDFTDVEGVKAYIAAGYNDDSKTVWLMRVYQIPANTGLLVKGTSGETYHIPHKPTHSYYSNMLIANTGEEITIGETDGDMTNYYLKNGKLLSVNESAKIGKNKSYLQVPTKVFARTRSIGYVFGDDGTTALPQNIIQPNQTNDVYYNLQGQRVNNPGKGLYIHNGKKVVIK